MSWANDPLRITKHLGFLYQSAYYPQHFLFSSNESYAKTMTLFSQEVDKLYEELLKRKALLLKPTNEPLKNIFTIQLKIDKSKGIDLELYESLIKESVSEKGEPLWLAFLDANKAPVKNVVISSLSTKKLKMLFARRYIDKLKEVMTGRVYGCISEKAMSIELACIELAYELTNHTVLDDEPDLSDLSIQIFTEEVNPSELEELCIKLREHDVFYSVAKTALPSDVVL